MSNYAIVNVASGNVDNVVVWDGSASSGWSPPDGSIAVQSDIAQPGWIYQDGVFSPPPPPPVIPLTPAEILSANQLQQSWLLSQASQKMAPVLVSLQLGDATDEEKVIARSWQAYYRSLQLVDLTVSDPAWPVIPA